MKINDLYTSSQAAATYQNQNTQRAQEAEGAQATSAAKKSSNSTTSGSDEVSLSSLANILQDAITESPDRTAYLKKLSSQFESGTYKVDANQIARSLVVVFAACRRIEFRRAGCRRG